MDRIDLEGFLKKFVVGILQEEDYDEADIDYQIEEYLDTYYEQQDEEDE